MTIDFHPEHYKHKDPQPYDHQREIFLRTANERSWALFMEMGTGKSKIIVDTFSYLYETGKIDTVVITAKKGEYMNWPIYQVPLHMPDRLEREVYAFNANKFNNKAAKQALHSIGVPNRKRLRIVVINIESMANAKEHRVMERIFKTSDSVFFVVDESTCVKTTKSKRSKACYQWAAKAKYKRIMTGTPVTQGPLDVWGQCMVLGKAMLGYTSFYSFRGHFADLKTEYFGNRSFQKVAGYKNLDKLTAKLRTFSHLVKKEECLDLPDKIYHRVPVEMTKEQESMYTQLRDEAMMTMQDGTELEITHILSLITKLHQITCGQMKYLDEHEKEHYVSIPNNRMEALLSILENHVGKAIIWATYRQTLADVVDELTKVYGEEAVAGYYGGTSDADRISAIGRFQDPNDPLRFIVGNPSSLGYGTTLTQADLVVYYSNSYNLEHRLQSEDRCHRIGQTRNVNYFDIVVPGTIDDRIVNILRQKDNLAQVVLGQDPRTWI